MRLRLGQPRSRECREATLVRGERGRASETQRRRRRRSTIIRVSKTLQVLFKYILFRNNINNINENNILIKNENGIKNSKLCYIAVMFIKMDWIR